MAAKDFHVEAASAVVRGAETGLVASLIRATGPVSYDYQFGPGDLLEGVVAASWTRPQTLFSADCAWLALDGDIIAGLEIGFAGADYYSFRNNLAALAPDLIADGRLDVADLLALAERVELASYLNAHVPPDVYYLHALATTQAHRGRGVGRGLLTRAIDRARAAGFRALHLDVLADNPAVAFYEAMGLSVLAEVRSPRLSRDHGFPGEFRMAVSL
jgi:GNAT superfamily N-acetyltransferase